MQDKLLEKMLFHLLCHEQHERMKRGFAKRLKGNVGPSEYTVIAEDGNHIPFEFNGNVLRNSDGSPFATVSCCTRYYGT